MTETVSTAAFASGMPGRDEPPAVKRPQGARPKAGTPLPQPALAPGMAPPGPAMPAAGGARPKAGRPVPFKPRVVPASAPAPVPPPAGAARRRPRHRGLVWSFVALVLLPTAIAASYLGLRAADQYASTAGFAVQSEKGATMIDLLGGISQLTGASDTQAGMVYQYLQSRDLVDELDRRLNLRARFSGPYRQDPFFGFDPAGSIEDLTDYWNRMTTLSYDSGTGLITLEVHAFSASDAQAIAAAAMASAGSMINRLSDVAQADATRAARAEVQREEGRLTQARTALRSFRERAKVIDPAADFTSQMGVISALQDQLAKALVDRDMITRTTRATDPRLAEADRRIAVIRDRIAAERQSFSDGQEGKPAFAQLAADYERLSAEQGFAEKTYATALGALDAAEAAARQQSLYLAAWQQPVTAESAQYPRRILLASLVALFAFLGWSVLALVYYSLRDRA